MAQRRVPSWVDVIHRMVSDILIGWKQFGGDLAVTMMVHGKYVFKMRVDNKQQSHGIQYKQLSGTNGMASCHHIRGFHDECV